MTTWSAAFFIIIDKNHYLNIPIFISYLSSIDPDFLISIFWSPLYNLLPLSLSFVIYYSMSSLLKIFCTYISQYLSLYLNPCFLNPFVSLSYSPKSPQSCDVSQSLKSIHWSWAFDCALVLHILLPICIYLISWSSISFSISWYHDNQFLMTISRYPSLDPNLVISLTKSIVLFLLISISWSSSSNHFILISWIIICYIFISKSAAINLSYINSMCYPPTLDFQILIFTPGSEAFYCLYKFIL